MLPESPRWLIANKKTEEAYCIMKHIANANKKKLDEKEWLNFANNVRL